MCSQIWKIFENGLTVNQGAIRGKMINKKPEAKYLVTLSLYLLYFGVRSVCVCVKIYLSTSRIDLKSASCFIYYM
jgi:hypothetical protein